MKKRLIIGVIGGTGKMGRLFRNFFEKKGFKVIIAGRKTKLTPKQLAKQADVVMITVPISATLNVIKDIAPLIKKDGLLLDLTSLKKLPVSAMLKNSSCEVIGTHPMFGPGVKSISGQTIILCPARGKKWLPWLKGILKSSNAIIKVTTPENHDKMMAVIQGLIHFSSITISHTMKELGLDIEESQHYASPIYRLRLYMVGRILNQDPELYADIETLNPEVMKVLDTYIKSSKKLIDMIDKKDHQGFIKYFKESSEYLGNFKVKAESKSNNIIKNMVKQK